MNCDNLHLSCYQSDCNGFWLTAVNMQWHRYETYNEAQANTSPYQWELVKWPMSVQLQVPLQDDTFVV